MHADDSSPSTVDAQIGNAGLMGPVRGSSEHRGHPANSRASHARQEMGRQGNGCAIKSGPVRGGSRMGYRWGATGRLASVRHFFPVREPELPARSGAGNRRAGGHWRLAAVSLIATEQLTHRPCPISGAPIIAWRSSPAAKHGSCSLFLPFRNGSRWPLSCGSFQRRPSCFRWINGSRHSTSGLSHLGPRGIVIFIAAYVLATVLSLPGLILTVGAGIQPLGLGFGLFAVTIQSTIGGARPELLIALFIPL